MKKQSLLFGIVFLLALPDDDPQTIRLISYNRKTGEMKELCADPGDPYDLED